METDAQWAGLRDALGRPPWAMADELTTVPGRRARHDSIDEHLARWCGERTGDEIVGALWDHGVPVAKVMQPHRQTELPQLNARGFFESVTHPVNPPTPHSTLPFRSDRGPQKVHAAPAPLLGQHNHDILHELGLGDDDIDRLEADGVIGTAPAR